MPIRHCQKCGLKVLIDESQASANPFYCQRCTAALQSEDRNPSPGEAPAPVKREAPNVASVRVDCPYCKASFNGRIPQKPARGSCPVCQKELVLLPKGEIRAAADFDFKKWQEEQAGGRTKTEVALAAKKPDTGVRDTAAKKIGTGLKQEAATPSTAPVETGGKSTMPSWLDDDPATGALEKPTLAPPGADDDTRARRKQAFPEIPPNPPPEPFPEPTIEVPLPAPELPLPPPATEPEPTPPRRLASIPHPAAVPRKAGLGISRPTDRRAGAGFAATPVAPSGTGKVVLAAILSLLPLLACPVLMRTREQARVPLEKISARFTKGFQALYDKIHPPPEAPKRPPTVKKEWTPPPPEEKKLTAAELEAEIDTLWTAYLREKRTVDQKAVGATEAEKPMIQKAREELDRKEGRINALREAYKKKFGKDYDPRNK